eukprot:CAMPEP_0196788970 /NCGR_PEP_ID=MMETSP1104-20130614/25822_1 /TAXON_ID=33652 /ORGANISM="Cafeteria sp., Strain Caron Lab Isolate" /LENGTH=37 /DNA_ID= /DNA_START= /DNA_END= /DNA_ORIENTATION=
MALSQRELIAASHVPTSSRACIACCLLAIHRPDDWHQ